MKEDNTVYCILLMVGLFVLWLSHAGNVRVPAPAPRTSVFLRSSPEVPIDPLAADVRTLRLLPGIGPKLARSLHHHSRVLELDSLDQLERIPGIGPSRARLIRDAVGDFEDNDIDVP